MLPPTPTPLQNKTRERDRKTDTDRDRDRQRETESDRDRDRERRVGGEESKYARVKGEQGTAGGAEGVVTYHTTRRCSGCVGWSKCTL